MVFDPFDRTPQEAKQATMRQPAPTVGKVATREIRDCFKVTRYGR